MHGPLWQVRFQNLEVFNDLRWLPETGQCHEVGQCKEHFRLVVIVAVVAVRSVQSLAAGRFLGEAFLCLLPALGASGWTTAKWQRGP